MGLTHSVTVRGAPDLRALLDGLQRDGLPSAILMIDNQLVPPGAPPPATWRDVRLKTPAGTIALKLEGGRVQRSIASARSSGFGDPSGSLSNLRLAVPFDFVALRAA